LLLLAKKRFNLTWNDFRNALIEFGVFSTGDIKKYFPSFHTRRLVEWQQKNYIQKLINKWYLFTELPVDEMLQYRISNCLCRPSYVSLESALSYYHFIPEAVYSQQAITTRKTILYKTPAGTFQYRTLKPAFYFGYHILKKNKLPVLLADPEKALLDYLYLSGTLNTIKDIEAMRFNYTALRQTIDWGKLNNYAQVFNSATLNSRISKLKKLSLNAHSV
jgi:predicted transcriptional regulator of viral defense system